MKTLRQYLPGDDVIQLVIRLGLLAFLLFWAFLIIRPFVPILTWSIVLAVAIKRPTQRAPLRKRPSTTH